MTLSFNDINIGGNSGGGGTPTNSNAKNYILKKDGTIENLKYKNNNEIAQSASVLDQDLTNVYANNTNIEYASFINVIIINSLLANTFDGCTGLKWVDFSNLKTINKNNSFGFAFNECTNLKTISFISLENIQASKCLTYAFSGSGIVNLSFPALNSNSFGENTNQFSNMLNEVDGCTVRFPSNLQSVIRSWSDVTNGFGGTNTTILYDLPATT